MTVQEIVEVLHGRGNSITYYIRKDGGILITSINGNRFIGAEGNRIARNMIGATLSEKRAKQLESIRPKRKAQLQKTIQNKIRRVQRKWKKNVKPSQGKITTAKVRYNIEHFGEQEALRKLNEAEKYASGVAYAANIDRLLEYINHYIDMMSSFGDDDTADKLQSLYDLIDRKRDSIKESAIQPIYNELYKLNTSPEEIDTVISNIELLIIA